MTMLASNRWWRGPTSPETTTCDLCRVGGWLILIRHFPLARPSSAMLVRDTPVPLGSDAAERQPISMPVSISSVGAHLA
jgi:hypothetical protein